MNFKHTALILLFFMCLTAFFTGCGSVPTPGENNKQDEIPIPDSPPITPPKPVDIERIEPPSKPATVITGDARIIPVTSEIINAIQNSGMNLKDLNLNYYLSEPFSLLRPERNNIPERFESKEGNLVRVVPEQREQNPSIVFNTTDAGTLRTIESEALVIVFQNIPLRFRRNSQGRYVLSSAEIESRTLPLQPGERLPHLCIRAELNDTLEVRTVADLTPAGSQRSTNVQQPAYRDTSGQSYQQNISYHASPSRQIMARGSVTPEGVAAYLRSLNRPVDGARLRNLINTYIYEAGIEGVNHDIAIAQMLYATDFLRNQRMATHNYAGFIINGSRLNGRPWNGRFDDMRTGVRAHIQHLKGYASRERPSGTLVDPRYHILVNLGYLGNVRAFDLLCRRWSENPEYGNRINRILDDLWHFSGVYR
jgi:hypothetical protein